MYRAGIRNSGSRTRLITVIGQDSANMATRITVSVITLPTTPPSVEVNACWAPMTSEFSREIRAPVWVRVKNASGWASTCRNTRVRRSKMRPSPMREEYQRPMRPTPASTRARTRTRTAQTVTTVEFPAVMPWSISLRNSSGWATTNNDEKTRVTRNQMISRLYGRANPMIRRTVPRVIDRSATDRSRVNDR